MRWNWVVRKNTFYYVSKQRESESSCVVRSGASVWNLEKDPMLNVHSRHHLALGAKRAARALYLEGYVLYSFSLNGKFHFLSNGNKQVKKWRPHFYNLLFVKHCEWAHSKTQVVLFGNICVILSVLLCPYLFSVETWSFQSFIKIGQDWHWLMQEVIFKDRRRKNIHRNAFFCKWDMGFLVSLSVVMS